MKRLPWGQLGLGVLLCLVIGSCGARRALSAASPAGYNISPTDLLDVARQVTQQSFRISQVAEDRFTTVSRWFKLDGVSPLIRPARGSGVLISYIVLVSRTINGDASFEVHVIAKRNLTGSGLEVYEADDIGRPGWIGRRAEVLAAQIADAVARYKVTR